VDWTFSGALNLAHAGVDTSGALAASLSYEEALHGLDGLVDFVNKNPTPSCPPGKRPLLLAQLLGGGDSGSKPYTVVSAREAYQRLLEEPDAQLIDIRPLKDARETVTPDLKEAKKKQLPCCTTGRTRTDSGRS
jgi:hypothetical protein